MSSACKDSSGSAGKVAAASPIGLFEQTPSCLDGRDVLFSVCLLLLPLQLIEVCIGAIVVAAQAAAIAIVIAIVMIAQVLLLHAPALAAIDNAVIGDFQSYALVRVALLLLSGYWKSETAQSRFGGCNPKRRFHMWKQIHGLIQTWSKQMAYSSIQ